MHFEAHLNILYGNKYERYTLYSNSSWKLKDFLAIILVCCSNLPANSSQKVVVGTKHNIYTHYLHSNYTISTHNVHTMFTKLHLCRHCVLSVLTEPLMVLPTGASNQKTLLNRENLVLVLVLGKWFVANRHFVNLQHLVGAEAPLALCKLIVQWSLQASVLVAPLRPAAVILDKYWQACRRKPPTLDKHVYLGQQKIVFYVCIVYSDLKIYTF